MSHSLRLSVTSAQGWAPGWSSCSLLADPLGWEQSEGQASTDSAPAPGRVSELKAAAQSSLP